MQVLGTVNSSQATNQQPGTVPGPVTANPVATVAPLTSAASTTPVAGTAGKKNSKNNANQRAICPKPLGADGLPRVSGTPAKKKKAKAASKGKESAQPDSLSDTLQIQIPESTTDPETGSAISSGSTDILAKAAESIFSSPNGEGGTVGTFFNDANDDNPLQIDTSVTETEDEHKSPTKLMKKSGQSSSVSMGLDEAVLGLNSVADGGKTLKLTSSCPTKVVNTISTVSPASNLSNDNVTSLSNTLEEIAGGFDFGDIGDSTVPQPQSKSGFGESEKPKKGKKTESKKDASSRQNKSSKSKNCAKDADKGNVSDVNKTDSDSQMDIESTLIHIPDNIEFSPNDLSDVLDQVEHMGSSEVDSPMAKGSKKSKSKRSKAADSENEPSSKKRKGSKEPTKESKLTPQRELLSMPTSLSVYDFDDSDSNVPSLLPLSGKDFNSSLPSTPAKPECLLTSDKADKNKASAQAKQKGSSQRQKPNTSRNNKTNKDPVSSVFPNSDVFEKDTSTKTTDNRSDSFPSNDLKAADAMTTLPEIDTTTSLFGFPVPPKKLPRTEPAPPTQTKTAPPQVSPKASPQANNPMVSPKQNLVSPKSSSGILSPNVPNSFSPELVSPKLSIVSPSQGILSDNESVTSPKGSMFKDTSPPKKRAPPDKFDEMKVRTFSALNSTSPVKSSAHGNTQSVESKDHSVVNSYAPVSTGVITSTRSVTPAHEFNKNKDPVHSVNKSDDMSGMNRGSVSESSSKGNDVIISSGMNTNTAKSVHNQKPMQGNRNNSTMDNPFNPQLNMNPAQQNLPPNSSSNSSQNNRYGPPFGQEPSNYPPMSAMNHPMPLDNSSKPGQGMNSYPIVPFSSDSIFNPQADKVIKSPPNVNISTLNQPKPDNGMSKIRNNAYSVDSFVQNSRDDGMRHRPDTLPSHAAMMPGQEFGSTAGELSRLPAASSPDFPNISLNLPPITSTAGNYMDNSSSRDSANNLNSFSFSLSSSSSTVSTASTMGQHQFPFFPPVLSSASNPPSSQGALPSSMPGMNMFDPSRGGPSDPMSRGGTGMHSQGPPGNAMQGGDMGREGMSRPDKPQSVMSDDGSQSTSTDKPSCSKQKMAKASGPATIQEPYPSPYNNSSSSHDNTYFRDSSQMKSNVGKSPTEQMRKPQEKPMDIGPPSRSSSQDKRNTNMERSPQMHNVPQSYYSGNYPSSKSLNTAPLHHPPSMMDERGRTMTRSPYEPPFSLPPASQSFNPMAPSFRPGNQFDPGPPSFSRDNSGTQPLSHTPVNASGRKSANPPPQQASVVKPPQKQSAPPLVPMNAGPQPPRPTPPQSHRATTPLGGNQAQVSHSRQSKQPSRSSKHPSSSSSSKKSKHLPSFMEVDSNLSNSIFETNRSMTPFFPSMQNLSPQSRAMQHESAHFQPGNFFGLGPRFPNSNTPVPKNTDIGPPFGNPFMPSRGSQNGPLGLNFQPGFGMNMNPLHGNHSNAPQLTPHTAPHMGNFNLNNIFSEGASQNESSLPISPIKFGHTNYQGMEHNAAMQHHHQYNRGHPSMMSLNSILGPNHHGFDGRMPTSMAGPFHGHGHPSFIPPLNFSMHDH